MAASRGSKIIVVGETINNLAERDWRRDTPFSSGKMEREQGIEEHGVGLERAARQVLQATRATRTLVATQPDL
jgi:hypothetical protein